MLLEKEWILQNIKKYMSQRGLCYPESDEDEMSEALHSYVQDSVNLACLRYMQAKLDSEQSSARLSSKTRLDSMEAELN